MPKIKYLSPRKIKETERTFGKDYRRGWLTKGKFTEDDFMLVMEYLGRLPAVPRTEGEFYEGLTAFLTDQCTESEKQFLYVIARKLIERDLFYFTEVEASRYSGINEKQMENMTACGIVHRTGRWHHFWNQSMMLYLAACSIREMSDLEKESYYRKDMWENWFFAQESEWVKYLVQNDRADFEKYLVRPSLSRFLDDIPGRSRETRAEWLMREMEWEWQIGTENEQEPSVITSVSYPKPVEIFAEIGWEVVDAAYDAFEQTVVDGLKEGKIQKFGRSVQGSLEFHIQDLLSSKTMRKYLMGKGCFAAMEKLLETMEQYVNCYEENSTI